MGNRPDFPITVVPQFLSSAPFPHPLDQPLSWGWSNFTHEKTNYAIVNFGVYVENKKNPPEIHFDHFWNFE